MDTEIVVGTIIVAWVLLGIVLAALDWTPNGHWIFGWWLTVTAVCAIGFVFYSEVIRNDDLTRFRVTHPDGRIEVLTEDEMYRSVDDLDDGLYTIDVYTPREYDPSRIGG